MKTLINNGKSWIAFLPLMIALFITLLILVISKFLPPKLPFFYSLPWGEKQLVTHQQLLIVPSVITLITLSNLILSWQLHSSQTFFKKILLFSSLLVSSILTITFFKIILLFI